MEDSAVCLYIKVNLITALKVISKEKESVVHIHSLNYFIIDKYKELRILCIIPFINLCSKL